MPLPSAWYISTGSGDEVVGMHPNSMRMAKRSILGRIAPELLAAETGFTQGSSVNIEEVLRLAPDVFVTYETRQTIADMEKTGIPVLSLDVLSQSKGNVFETYFGWMKLLGQIAGQQERTDKIVAYANDVLMHTRSHIAHLSEN
jgi:iron complex transport system substrate-binding protein